MNPRSMSVWIFPAAWGAFVCFGIVQALTLQYHHVRHTDKHTTAVCYIPYCIAAATTHRQTHITTNLISTNSKEVLQSQGFKSGHDYLIKTRLCFVVFQESFSIVRVIQQSGFQCTGKWNHGCTRVMFVNILQCGKNI